MQGLWDGAQVEANLGRELCCLAEVNNWRRNGDTLPPDLGVGGRSREKVTGGC